MPRRILNIGLLRRLRSSTDDEIEERCQPHVLRAVNSTRGTVVAERVTWATGDARQRGLLGRTSLDPDEGMYIVPTHWIHMFGMRFSIDVVFLSKRGRVVAVQHGLKRNRVSRLVPSAEGALELPAGTLRATQTAVGDQIEFEEIRSPS